MLYLIHTPIAMAINVNNSKDAGTGIYIVLINFTSNCAQEQATLISFTQLVLLVLSLLNG